MRTDSASVGITLHQDGQGDVICSAINYTYDTVKPDFKISNGYKIGEVLYGNTDSIGVFDGVIFKLKKI